jgi:hypothetical protein
MREIRLIGTTISAGTVTVTSETDVIGYINRITWLDGTLADGVDAVLTLIANPNMGVDETLFTITNGNDDAVYYPGDGVSTWPYQLIAGKLSLAITSGGSVLTGGMVVYIDEEPALAGLIKLISGGGAGISLAPTAAAHAAKSGAGAAVSITLAAAASIKHKLAYVVAGYDAVPAAGAYLLITDDSAVVFQIPITAAGPLFIPLNIQSAVANKAMVLTLSAPGGAVLGYINIPGTRSEA